MQIVLTTDQDVRRVVTAEYRVTVGLMKRNIYSNMLAAMDCGILPDLASAQLLMRLVSDISDPKHTGTTEETQWVMNAVVRDVTMTYVMMIEVHVDR
ncbi:hypothetical protein FS764_23425 [Agrobacterium vitis]|uniref:hypothetical protein n=1 Tax=Rhizobium/Agrobacterium group TaxID=227290 RepID=UPI000712E65B|nr:MULTISPECIES: hypothetical protein [Rhizobium/Agrobacterium group]KQO78415.1 hypothetical protein ASF29_23680 [Rhizobium sp. Leaf262]MCF1469829.1 hypothetical protein [Agrobacterium vitis]